MATGGFRWGLLCHRLACSQDSTFAVFSQFGSLSNLPLPMHSAVSFLIDLALTLAGCSIVVFLAL